MTKVRIPRAVCAVIGEVLFGIGSHKTVEALFLSAGAPGPPPDLPHSTKWKTWLFQAGNDPSVDGLAVMGNILEEFMDVAPSEFSDAYDIWVKNRERIVNSLEEYGFRYYRGCRVLPNGDPPIEAEKLPVVRSTKTSDKPRSIEELLFVLLRGLRRAMHPLTHLRKDAHSLVFDSEYDVQDLLHSQLRPWVADIRP